MSSAFMSFQGDDHGFHAGDRTVRGNDALVFATAPRVYLGGNFDAAAGLDELGGWGFGNSSNAGTQSGSYSPRSSSGKGTSSTDGRSSSNTLFKGPIPDPTAPPRLSITTNNRDWNGKSADGVSTQGKNHVEKRSDTLQPTIDKYSGVLCRVPCPCDSVGHVI